MKFRRTKGKEKSSPTTPRKRNKKIDTLGRRASSGCKGYFTEDMIQQAEMLSLLGATDKQMALFFDVAPSLIIKWKERYPEFYEATKKGGLTADMKVAASLYQRAIGFEYPEIEITEQAIRDKDGNTTPFKRITRKTTIKKVIPDVKAATHWLRNRQRDLWTEAPYRVENYIKGEIQHNHDIRKISEIPIDKLSEDAQALIFEIGRKQLEEGKRDN